MTLTDYITRRMNRSTAAAPTPAAESLEAHPDAVYLRAWGLTPSQWAAMDDATRVWHRWNFNTAPGFSELTRG